MRVLQLIDSLHPGGAERVAVSYANALSQQQAVDSFLCTTRAEGDLKDQLKEEVGYLYLRKTSAYDMVALMKLIRFCKRNQIGVIHAHTTSYFTATLVKVFMPRMKLVWHDHYGKSEQLNQRPKGFLKWCSRYFDQILAVNEQLTTWAEQELRCPKVSYLKNAVPIFEPELINAVELPGKSGFRILLLANLRKQKDHINAIMAVKKIREDFPEVSLHMLGMHWDDDYFRSVMMHMDQAEEREYIHYHGSQQNVNGYIKACDLGLLSSNSEGLPMALLEYAAMELPVVCTTVGQCKQVIQDDGYTAKAEDYAALAEKLSEALGDPLKAKMKAQRLRERVAAEYSIQTIIPKLLTVYGRLD